jgi:hypothetical protein
MSYTKKVNFTSLILLFGWIDLNVQVPLLCPRFAIFIEHRNTFDSIRLAQTELVGGKKGVCNCLLALLPWLQWYLIFL